MAVFGSRKLPLRPRASRRPRCPGIVAGWTAASEELRTPPGARIAAPQRIRGPWSTSASRRSGATPDAPRRRQCGPRGEVERASAAPGASRIWAYPLPGGLVLDVGLRDDRLGANRRARAGDVHVRGHGLRVKVVVELAGVNEVVLLARGDERDLPRQRRTVDEHQMASAKVPPQDNTEPEAASEDFVLGARRAAPGPPRRRVASRRPAWPHGARRRLARRRLARRRLVGPSS